MEDLLAEAALRETVDLLVRLVEAAGAVVVFVGAAIAFGRFVAEAGVRRRTREFVAIRLTLGRYLALGLELQLASDILSTAVAPSLEEIGKLAAIAAIRTLLNYFLRKEVEEERRQVEEERARRSAPV